MKFKVVADTLSEEELVELENRDISTDIQKGLNNRTIIFSSGPWNKSVQLIRKRKSA